MRTHYQVLNVPETATSEEIKKAYKRLVFLYHPDRNGGDLQFHNLIVKVNEAYSVLINPSRRLAYDCELNSKKTPPPPRYSEDPYPRNVPKKESRWSFTSPVALAIWFCLTFVGKMVNNYNNQRDNQLVPMVQGSGFSNPSIQGMFSPKPDFTNYNVPEYNRIYDSLNPHNN